MRKPWKSWFWPANGVQSNHSLVKIHNTSVSLWHSNYPSVMWVVLLWPPLIDSSSIFSLSFFFLVIALKTRLVRLEFVVCPPLLVRLRSKSKTFLLHTKMMKIYTPWSMLMMSVTYLVRETYLKIDLFIHCTLFYNTNCACHYIVPQINIITFR